MKRTGKRILVQGAIAAAALASLHASNAAARDDDQGHDHDRRATVQHVLLISFNGLHEQDVARCVASNACPNLALLEKSGVTYSNAYTPGLSDSFPGLAALVTGGSPKTAGLFYDVSYDRTLYAPSDTTCAGQDGTSCLTRPPASMPKTAARSFISMAAAHSIRKPFPTPGWTASASRCIRTTT